ncbi:MAG: T9SS type A sorting domain-containing protein [Bacteroidetes bacterium]|nr:T9SS type A sorting domain-containing protein [Bacteroidota bacterium]
MRLVYALLFGILMLTASTASAQEDAERVSPVQMPSGYMLESAYPNPFNPSATIGFAVVRTQNVELGLYNALGRKVRTLFSGRIQGQTRFEAQVNGEGLPSGLYLVRLVGDSFSTTRRVTLLK